MSMLKHGIHKAKGGTMRGQKDAVKGLTQWIGRKVRNHQPLKELMPTGMSGKETLGITTTLSSEDTVYLRMGDGRKFAIIVTEVTEQVEPAQLVKVGA